MTYLRKMTLLTSLAFKDPAEFADRIRAIIEIRAELSPSSMRSGKSIDFDTLLQEMSSFYGEDLAICLREPALLELEHELAEKARELSQHGPFPLFHNADVGLARICYAVCRITKPNVVLETGTAYGVTSSYFLQALAVNGQGVLHSVDLPPLGERADEFVGILIPQSLRNRWHLHRGASRRILAQLLMELKTIDAFLHDSLHTYSNILFELEEIVPYLSHKAVVLADDIEGNNAFDDWAASLEMERCWSVEEENKDSKFGIAITGRGWDSVG